MKKLLLAGVFTLAITPAMADAIVATARVDGFVVAIESSATGTLNVVNQSFGPLFDLNTLSVDSESVLTPPDYLKTNTLNVDQIGTGNHQLVIDVVATGLTGPNALKALLSEFSVTGMTTGWSASEQTFINGNPLSSTGLFFTPSGSADIAGSAFLGPTFNAEVIYTINSAGVGSFNGGIDISAAAVPGPVVGAGLPGILGGLAMLGLAKRRRRV